MCETLRVQHPDILIITIHDSILSPEECVPTIEKVILAEFARIGVVSTLH